VPSDVGPSVRCPPGILSTSMRQALVAEAAVEALDVGVLHRLARQLDEAQFHTVLRRPGLIMRPANSGPLSVQITLGRHRSALT
jgi:hypothetical protein